MDWSRLTFYFEFRSEQIDDIFIGYDNRIPPKYNESKYTCFIFKYLNLLYEYTYLIDLCGRKNVMS